MSQDADLSRYSREVVKQEVKKEFANLDLFKVGNELLRGKTDTLENAMEEVVGRTTLKVCGKGAMNELKLYTPYLVGGAIIGLGYYLHKKGK